MCGLRLQYTLPPTQASPWACMLSRTLRRNNWYKNKKRVNWVFWWCWYGPRACMPAAMTEVAALCIAPSTGSGTRVSDQSSYVKRTASIEHALGATIAGNKYWNDWCKTLIQLFKIMYATISNWTLSNNLRILLPQSYQIGVTRKKVSATATAGVIKQPHHPCPTP